MRRSPQSPKPPNEEEILLPADAKTINYTKVNDESTVLPEVYVGYSTLLTNVTPLVLLSLTLIDCWSAHYNWPFLSNRMHEVEAGISQALVKINKNQIFNQSVSYSVNQLSYCHSNPYRKVGSLTTAAVLGIGVGIVILRLIGNRLSNVTIICVVQVAFMAQNFVFGIANSYWMVSS